mmetsp:Transcript_36849/g.72470  ORF Transcript_36849/g.72470 Transcript_36849/m.72470 type:complete len:300 (-) Transcript_36849:439-1338(-)
MGKMWIRRQQSRSLGVPFRCFFILDVDETKADAGVGDDRKDKALQPFRRGQGVLVVWVGLRAANFFDQCIELSLDPSFDISLHQQGKLVVHVHHHETQPQRIRQLLPVCPVVQLQEDVRGSPIRSHDGRDGLHARGRVPQEYVWKYRGEVQQRLRRTSASTRPPSACDNEKAPEEAVQRPVGIVAAAVLVLRGSRRGRRHEDQARPEGVVGGVSPEKVDECVRVPALDEARDDQVREGGGGGGAPVEAVGVDPLKDHGAVVPAVPVDQRPGDGRGGGVVALRAEVSQDGQVGRDACATA